MQEMAEEDKYTLLSELTMDSFVCSKCLNYLSVGPCAAVGENIVCGRCPRDVDVNLDIEDRDLTRRLFRCVNRFDGCRQLLTYREVKEHEEYCSKKMKICQCCYCSFSGNLCQLYNHFRKSHSSDFMKISSSSNIYLNEKSFPLKKILRYQEYLVAIKAEMKKGVLHLKIMNYGHNNQGDLAYTVELKNIGCEKGICPVGNEVDESYDHFFEIQSSKESSGTTRWRKIPLSLKLNIQKHQNSYISLKSMKFCVQEQFGTESFVSPRHDHVIRDETPFKEIVSTQTFSPTKVGTVQIENKTFSDASVQIDDGLSKAIETKDAGLQTNMKSFSDASVQTKECSQIVHNDRSDSELNRKLKKEIGEITSKLWSLFKCSNCESFACMPDQICWCPKMHVKCEECSSDFCKLCDDISNYTLVNDGRTDILKLIVLPCRWKCLEVFGCEVLRTHEATCKNRQYPCPLLCGWMGSLNELKKHWHSREVPLVENSCEVDSFTKQNKEATQFFMLYDGECYNCQFSPAQTTGWIVHVRKSTSLTKHVKDGYVEIELKKLYSSSMRHGTMLCKMNFGDTKLINVPDLVYYKLILKPYNSTNQIFSGQRRRGGLSSRGRGGGFSRRPRTKEIQPDFE